MVQPSRGVSLRAHILLVQLLAVLLVAHLGTAGELLWAQGGSAQPDSKVHVVRSAQVQVHYTISGTEIAMVQLFYRRQSHQDWIRYGSDLDLISPGLIRKLLYLKDISSHSARVNF